MADDNIDESKGYFHGNYSSIIDVLEMVGVDCGSDECERNVLIHCTVQADLLVHILTSAMKISSATQQYHQQN